MAEEKKSIEISYKANLSDLKAKLKTIPNITDQEAKKMVAALDRQLKQAEKAAKRASQASQKAARASAKAAKRGSVDFKKLASSASMVGASFAVMGAGVLAFSQQLADLTNELTDASAKSGIAVETLAGLRLAAKGSGMEFSNLESGLIRFQTSVLDASRGSKSMTENFKALGVEVKNTDGSVRDADSVFNDAIRSLGEMENTTERNALAMKLFGREGGAGLIQSGALDSLENMKQFAKEFGVAIDEDAIGSMGRFQRKMAEFDTVAQGTMQRLLGAITGSDDGITAGIDMATKAIVAMGSIAEDSLNLMSAQFEQIFLSVKAAGMVLDGDFAGALELSKLGAEKVGQAIINVANQTSRAAEKVAELEKLSSDRIPKEKEIEKSIRRQTKAEEETVDTKKEALELAKQQAKIQKDLQRFREKQAQSEQDIIDARKELSELLIGISGSEIDQINLKYDKEIERLQELSKKAEESAGVQKAIQDLEEKRNDEIHKKKMDQFKIEQQEAIKQGEEIIGALSNAFNASADSLEDLANRREQENINQMENELRLQRLQELGETDRIKNLEERTEAVKSIEEQMEKDREDFAAKRQQAEAQAAAKVFGLRQGAALAETGMNIAKGIVNALATYPGPVGIGLAGLIGATGAAQMAAIASQQPPSFHMGGMLANDEMGARVLRGEAVLDRATVRRIGGEEGVKKLQQGNGTGDNVMVIQPFRHFGRFAREIGFKPARKTGIRRK